MAVEGYINTIGRNHLGIGICDRCKRKFPIDDLYSDHNIPGLKVCIDDVDEYDPYREPARQPEMITLRYPRPDVALDGVAPVILVGIWDQSLWDQANWS